MGDAKESVILQLSKGDGTTIDLGASLETAEAYVQTKLLDGGQDAFVKFLQRILHNIRDVAKAETLRIEILGTDTEDEDTLELLWTVYPNKEDPGYIDPDGKRFYAIRFYDPSVKVRWAIHGFSLFGELGGEEF